jgi:multiple sugar transport system substrate-binding protein
MRRAERILCVAGAGLLAGAAYLAGPAPVAAQDLTIRMAVPDWPPTRIMQDLANERYKSPSGKDVKLEADFIPWSVYYERLAASLTSGEKKYQMVVSDSQWLGAFVEGGYYKKINEYVDKDPELQAIFKDLHPNLVASYSTYPHKSENLYGFPQFPDVLIAYYRNDVFCHPEEQAAYEAKYGAKLPCDPADMDKITWNEVRNFGEFFRRSKGDKLAGETLNDDFYGIAYQAGKDYDFALMQVNGFIWQHGASIWDETKQPDGQAEGIVNSPEAVKAFEQYLSLTQYMPPVVKTGTMDIFKTDEVFREGKVAYAINWIGLGESSLNPQTSKVTGKVAFARHPGTKGPDGQVVNWANIGGQPFVLTTWNDEGTTAELLNFVKWWLSPEIQTEFTKRGGQSGRRSVFEKADYNTFRPWNRTWAASLDWQKDVWHVPDFFELLVQSQEEYVKAITGQQDAKTTMDNIATFQQDLLSQAGLIN